MFQHSGNFLEEPTDFVGMPRDSLEEPMDFG